MIFQLNKDGKLELDADVFSIPKFRAVLDAFPLEEAEKYLAIMYFSQSTDTKNPYYGYSEETRIPSLVKEFLGEDPKTYKLPKVVQEGIRHYAEMEKQDPQLRILRGMKIAMDKTSEFLETVEYITKKDGPLPSDPTKVMAMLKGIGPLITSYQAILNSVKQGQKKDSKIRGGGEKGMFEDPT